MPNPLDNPSAYDVAIVGGQATPGICTIKGASSPRKWDERQGPGTSGATLVYMGRKLARFTMSLQLLTSEDFDAWESFRPILEPPSNGRAKALDISHPYLEPLGITSVVVEELGQVTPEGDAGAFVVEIKFAEYREPAPAKAKPSGSKGAGSGGAGGAGGASEPSPEDEYDRRIRELTSQVQELA